MIVKLREEKNIQGYGSDRFFPGPTTLWLSMNVYSLDTKSRLRAYERMNGFCEAINKRIGAKIRRTKSFVIPMFAVNNRIQMLEILIMVETHFVPDCEGIKEEIKAIVNRRRIQFKEAK